MSEKIYLWLEDREEKSGFIFWKTMMQQLFSEVVVQSKKNNSELIKAVKALDDESGMYITTSIHKVLYDVFPEVFVC